MCGEFLSTRNEFWTSFADKRKISFSKAQSPEEEKNLSIDVDTHFLKVRYFQCCVILSQHFSQLKSLKEGLNQRQLRHCNPSHKQS